MNQGRCCRAVRAAVFAATCVLLASLAHVLMTGTAVPWWVMAAASVATGALAWFLAEHERGLLAVASATVAVQAVLHTGFSLAQAAARPAASAGPSSGRPPPGAAGHVHHAVPMVTGSGTPMAMPMPMPMPVQRGSVSSAGMLAAHLLAALLCGLWLAYGERGAFRVLRAVAGLLLVPLRPVFRLPAPPDRPRLRARRDGGTRRPRGLLLVHAITSRGPPHGIAVI
ncbi:hypothetical protein AB0I68_12700 [Streptomyces sp. NPDC050448]|uniref:hypothetical protein n=1 Tax=Streptomyces sp. NPDC050448 TaxID=3155404 RepID=UPI00343A7B59